MGRLRDPEKVSRRSLAKKRFLLAKTILAMTKQFPLLGGLLIGWMGTGKTNTIACILNNLPDTYEKRYYQALAHDEDDLKKRREQVVKKIVELYSTPASKSNLAIVVDDASFILQHVLRTHDSQVASAMSTARHRTGARQIISMFALHHMNAVSPFLKENVQFMIFTSIDNRTANKLIDEWGFRDPITIRFYQSIRRARMDYVLFCDAVEGFCALAWVPLCSLDKTYIVK